VDDEPWDVPFEEMTVPVRVAASMLGLSPHTVSRLITAGHLTAHEERQFRYVTLASLFAYRRAHWSPDRAERPAPAEDDDTTALDQAAGLLAG
jgi:hypothetical protein